MTAFDPVQKPKHYNSHPSGIECIEIVEYMSFNLGNAFKYLWRGGLKASDATEDYRKALWYLERHDQQRHPIPFIPPLHFKQLMMGKKVIFNRPSPWCEGVRHALAAICDLCSIRDIAEQSRLTQKAILCVKQALEDEQCLGRAMQP